jgi:hypothetical protein
MNRTTKQIVYGAAYAAVWFFLIYGGYALTVKAPPSCIDRVQNRDEAGIDCGGVFCQSCEVKSLSPIEFNSVELLSSAGGKGTTALVEIRNKNVTHGTAKLTYTVLFYGSSSTPLYQEIAETPVYPSEVKYRLSVNVPVAFDSVKRAVATTTTPYVWEKITSFSRPKTPLRSITTEYSTSGSKATITGLVKNDNPFGIRRVTVNVLMYEKSGKLVGVSKTFAQDLVAAEERYFKVDVPLIEGVDTAQLVEPRVIIEAER